MSNIRAPNKSRTQRPFEPDTRFWQWGIPIIVVGMTVAAFYPALQNNFVNWDDYKNIVENSHYRGLGWANIRWMFTTFHMGHYQPLTWVTLGMDYVLWGMNPFGYHLTSLILHAATAVAFFFLALEHIVDCHRQRGKATGGLGGCSGFGSSVCLASSSGGIGGLGDRAPRRAFRAVLRVDYSGLLLCLEKRKIPPWMVLVGTGPFPLRDSVKINHGYPSRGSPATGYLSAETARRKQWMVE